MPIYQYECACGYSVELMVRIGHNKAPYCGRCAPERVRKMKRVITTPPMGFVKNPAVPRRAK